MPASKNRMIVLASRPVGEPKPDDFRSVEGDIEQPGPGEVLLKTLWLSLDPYMRGRMSAAKSYADPLEIGEVMTGGTVSKVVSSNNKALSVGDIVVGYTGWQEYARSDGSGLRKVDPALAPISTALGILGMPGMTAYTGLLNIGQPKPGETLVVAAASGAVGAMVGQIAKLKGCRVVGIAGGADKVRYVTEELGFDVGLDHGARIFPTGCAPQCRTASTSISRMSAAMCGRRCSRCSIGSRASRSAVSSPITMTPGRKKASTGCPS